MMRRRNPYKQRAEDLEDELADIRSHIDSVLDDEDDYDVNPDDEKVKVNRPRR